MGIIKLIEFIRTRCPQAISLKRPIHYKGLRLAIDTPSTMYQFLVKTVTSNSNSINSPVDDEGNKTGHLLGVMYRALLCREVGIEPIWVLDGTPPAMKLDELAKRKKKKQQSVLAVKNALIAQDFPQAAKFTKRSIRITKQEKQDAQQLIRAMGMIAIVAPGEAEAQCTYLAKSGLVSGVISQDGDTLAMGCPKLIRSFGRERTSEEINLAPILAQLALSYEQFVDFCILCGCDYGPKIPNVGPIRGMSFIKTHGDLKSVVSYLKTTEDLKVRERFPVPAKFDVDVIRKLMITPEVRQIDASELQRPKMDQNKFRQFLQSKQFSPNRIDNWLRLNQKYSKLTD